MSSRRIVIDSDGGVDDVLAVALAATALDAELAGLCSVHGNVPESRAFANLELTLDLLGRSDVPLSRGRREPLRREPVFARHAHGEDGLGGQGRRYRQEVERSGREHDGRDRESPDCATLVRRTRPGVLLAIGPLTNVAVTMREGPELPEDTERLVVMGGADGPGNITPHAEFNAFADPEAAAAVLEHPPVPVDLVPLDVTRSFVLERGWLNDQTGRWPSLPNRFLRDIHQHYMDFSSRGSEFDGCHPHDSIALLAALEPDAFHWESCRVSVGVADGSGYGATSFEPVATAASGAVRVARGFRSARLLARLERLFQVAGQTRDLFSQE